MPRVLLGPPNYPFFGISGVRKGGKSVTDEFITEYYYLKLGFVALDLWAAMDRENAFWCIPDIYLVFWNLIVGRNGKMGLHELKLAKFCRLKLGLQWFKVIKDQVLKKRIRNYSIEQPEPKAFIIRQKGGAGFVSLKLNERNDKVLLEYVSEAGQHQAVEYDVIKDGYGNTRIEFPNPHRKDNNARTVGYPVLIILSENSKIVQFNPRCVCGRLMKDHPQNQLQKTKQGGPQQADEQLKEAIANYPCKLVNMPLIRTIPDTTPFQEIIKRALKERRIVVLNRGFYSYAEKMRPYGVIHEYLRQLPYIVNDKIIPTSVSIVLTLRELSTIVPAGMKAFGGRDITDIKRSLQEFLKEARHFRTTIVTDYQAGEDILGSILDKRDFLIMKRSTEEIIPGNFKWFYKEIKRRHAMAADSDDINPWPMLEDLKPWQAYVIYPEGKPAYELRTTSLPKIKHKEPNDDWEMLADCQIVHDIKAQAAGDGKGAKGNKPKDPLRERAMQRIHELMQKEPDKDWDWLAKEVGLIDKKTGKVASGNAARMAYGRWRDQKQKEKQAEMMGAAGASISDSDDEGNAQDNLPAEEDGDNTDIDDSAEEDSEPDAAGPNNDKETDDGTALTA